MIYLSTKLDVSSFLIKQGSVHLRAGFSKIDQQMAVVETTIEVRSQQRSAVAGVGWYALRMASTLATFLVGFQACECRCRMPNATMQNHKSESKSALKNGFGRREVLCAPKRWRCPFMKG
jgi:hypothetical protein